LEKAQCAVDVGYRQGREHTDPVRMRGHELGAEFIDLPGQGAGVVAVMHFIGDGRHRHIDAFLVHHLQMAFDIPGRPGGHALRMVAGP
jgi:hypothetical protein